jgi:phage/conjugal plasmid C-4 type zinc finger TraR family protein
MATGWAGDGAVHDQIDATVSDAVKRARNRLPAGDGLTNCEGCGAEIPEARRAAVPGVRLCVVCQEAEDRELAQFSGYNRRGSKDSQLR